MTDLTKQWKEKTLESCQDYYVKYKNGVIGRAKLLETPDFYGFYNNCPLDDMMEDVLAPVPSYDEWIVTKSAAESYHALQEKNVELVHEINKRNDLLKECLRYIDMWGYSDSHGDALWPQIKRAIGESEE